MTRALVVFCETLDLAYINRRIREESLGGYDVEDIEGKG